MGVASHRMGRRPVLLFGLAIAAVLMAFIGFVGSFHCLAVLIFSPGVTAGAIWIVCPVTAAMSVAPRQRGGGHRYYGAFFDLGSILGPMIMWAVMESRVSSGVSTSRRGCSSLTWFRL
jgi:MFS family permease